MTTLGQRMKMYEDCSNNTLMRKTPVVIRVDGKAFHTYVKNFNSIKYGPFHNIIFKNNRNVFDEVLYPEVQ